MKASVIAMWVVGLSVAFAEKLAQSYFLIVKDAVCDASTLRETTARSKLLCAGECRSDAKCVAYSRRGSQCVLHHKPCSWSDLLPEAGAHYVGK